MTGPKPAGSWALVLMLAAVESFAQTAPDERLCRSMAQRLERMEASPRTRPETLDRAREQVRRQCDQPRPATRERDPADGTARATAGPATPDAAWERAHTPGRFADWNAELDAVCRQPAAPGADSRPHTRCAQAKIDRALAEKRLSAGEVEPCLNQPPSPPATAAGPSARQRERADARAGARLEALGGPAYWAWEGQGGCRLVDRVRMTFAEPAGRAPNADTASAQALMCRTDPRLPFCGGASASPRQAEAVSPYWRWQHEALRSCVAQPSVGQTRDHCARSIVERALAERRVAAAAVDRCRAGWQAGPRAEPEMMVIDQCLVAASVLEQAATSRFVDAAPARTTAPMPFGTQGLARADIVAPLYAGDLARVPAEAEDLRYVLTTFGRVNESCPQLGLAGTAMQIAQASARQTQEALARGLSGRGSAADAMTVLGAANELLRLLPDCDRIQDDEPRRRACIADKEGAFKVQPSAPGVADAGRLIERHGCTSAQLAHYGRQLGAWLMLPPDQRGVLDVMQNHPQAAVLSRLLDNCRRQSGDGSADAWCTCYVRGHALAPRGSRAAPSDVLDAAARSAFIGGPQAWYVPPDADECAPKRQAIERWRREQSASRPVVTACLAGQQPAAVLLRPELQVCRYRTAAGLVELRAQQCAPRLHAHEWGSEAVSCDGRLPGS